MTTLQDTLTYADGSPVNGQVIVHTGPFQISGVSIAGSAETYEIVDGNMTIPLYPNINAQPIGTYYTAKYELQNGAVYEEYWIVPNLPVVNLGQCRVLFPPTPSVLISATQIMSTGAQPGMILSWNGSHWVPGYVTMLNVTPNTIGLTLSSTPAANLSVGGSPATLGGSLSLNVPDAGPTSRGVVTTGAQGFSGVKTFFAAASFPNGVQIQGSSTINGYVPTTRMVATGYGLTGGGDLSADRTLAVVDRSSVQKIQVDNNNTPVGTQGELNFMPGANISLNIVNDATHNRVNVSITSTAGVPSYSVNGAAVGSRSTLNLIAGSGMTITGVDNAAAGSVDVTFVSTGSGGGGGAVASVFGRTGTVVAQAGDYQAAQVTNAVSTLGSYADPSWITSLAWAKITGAPPLGVQTPWASNIDAAGFNLNNLNQINGTASSSLVLNAFGASISFNIVAAPVATLTPTAFNGPRTVSAVATASGNSPALQVVNSTGSSWQLAMDPGVSGTNYLSFLFNSGLVAVLTPNYRLGIGLSTPAYAVDVIGDVNVTGVYRVNGVPLATSVQTPWTQNINAASFTLYSVGLLGVGNNATVLPDVDPGSAHVIVGPTTATTAYGETTVCGNTATLSARVGLFNFANYGITGAEKRIAALDAITDGATNSGAIRLITWNAGAPAVRMQISAAGNVGIGTPTSPFGSVAVAGQTSLSVKGASDVALLELIGAQPDVAGNPQGTLAFVDSNNTSANKRMGYVAGFLTGSTAGNRGCSLAFATRPDAAGTPIERMRIDHLGDVGIGTASPSTILHVLAAPTADTNVLIDVLNQTTVSPLLSFREQSAAIWNVGLDTTDSAKFKIATGGGFNNFSGGTKLTITGTGNVGIGTAFPTHPLQILATATAVGANTTALYIQRSSGSSFAGIAISGVVATTPCIYCPIGTDDLAFGSDSGGTSISEKMRITGPGLVGIGTAAPNGALDVVGVNGLYIASNATGDSTNNNYQLFRNTADGYFHFVGYQPSASGYVFYTQTGTGQLTTLTITNAGSVGVLDNNPATALAVKGASHFYPVGATPDNGYNGIIRMTAPPAVGQLINLTHQGQIAWSIGYIPNAQTFAIGTGQATDSNFTAPQFVITPGALVGINKPSPAYALDVVGAVNCTGGFLVNGTAIGGGGTINFQANNTGFGSAATLNLVGAGSTAVSGIITAGTVASYSINSSSDRRLKQNIQPLAGGMPIIEQLLPVRAEWNGLGGKKAGEPIISIIAQELQAVIPDAVYSYKGKLLPDDAEYVDLLGFEPMGIVSHLILAVQQLQRELKALKQKAN